MMNYQIIELDKSKWQGFLLPFRYIAHEAYKVMITRSTLDDFRVELIRRTLDTPYNKTPHESDKLFQPWVEHPRAWGIVEDGELIAAIETSLEDWNKRLIVTELWVHENHRRKGLARALMDKAMERARCEHCRALILETQSCNTGAIDFYLHYGFMLIGLDAIAYQNNDVQRGEVRLDFGILLDASGG